MSRSFKIISLVFVFLLLPQLAGAQEETRAFVSAPKTDAFPEISAFLEVRDEQGRFVSGLTAGEMTVIENGERIPVDSLRELQPGVQFVVAINPGRPFSIRDSQAVTRYEYIVEALDSWASALGANHKYDLSLLMNAAPDAVHLTDAGEWLDALYAAPSDHRNAIPNLSILSQAISVAADTTPRQGMGRAVLFITPNPDQATAAALGSLTAQAQQAGVHIFVWMVAAESYFNSPGALALQEMAFATGGNFFAYSGTQPFPDIDAYLEPLSRIYAFSYTSRITARGEQELAVEIDSPAIQTTSAIRTFSLDVQPPNPFLVSPPAEIYRAVITDESNQVVGFTPEEQTIEIMVEFPDGYERDLARTTLYVNGKIAAENTAPPFKIFTWDLSEITESGEFVIQVEAVDSLGLSSVSMATPVDITVQRLPEGFAAEVSRNSSIIAVVAVLIAGSILILALVMVMRKRHQPHPNQMGKRRKKRKPPASQPPPVNGNGAALTPRKRLPTWARQIPGIPGRIHWPRGGRSSRPYGYLERVYDPDSIEALTPTQPIPLTMPEITLGADPERATLVLEDPSVDKLHARLRRGQDGKVYLQDNGSVAGTWINFTLTNSKEMPLQDGDMIHIGRAAFRFKLNDPAAHCEPEVIFEEL